MEASAKRPDDDEALKDLVRDVVHLQAFEARLDAAVPPRTSSIELVRGAQKGDEEAFGQLVDRYYDRVRRIVRMRLGHALRSRVEIEDVLQDTFMAAVQSFDRFEVRDEASLINWLAQLAQRQILAAADYHGAKKRDRRREVRLASAVSTGESGDISFQLAAATEAPLERLSRAEQAALLESCVAELSEEYRELIILRDYTGASWDAIATLTHRPNAPAARMMHTRALLELGRLMRSRSAGHPPN